MFTKLAPSALFLLLLPACGDSPGALGPGEATESRNVAASAVAAGQQDDILALIDAQAAAWAAKDGNAYGATYTEDAVLVNPVGGILVGSALIASQHVFLFNPVNGPFRASSSSWTLRELTFLTGALRWWSWT